MYCYPMAIKDKPRGYQKRMHQQLKDRGNLECTEQRLCDQKKQIEGKTLLTPAEIEEVKQQEKSDTFQEEDDQQAEEEQQTGITILKSSLNQKTQYHQYIMKHQMMMMTMTNCKMNT